MGRKKTSENKKVIQYHIYINKDEIAQLEGRVEKGKHLNVTEMIRKDYKLIK